MFTRILTCLCDTFDDLKNMYLTFDEDCQTDHSSPYLLMSGLIRGQAGLNSLNLPCVRLLISNFHWLETDQVLRLVFHQPISCNAGLVGHVWI